MSSGEVPKQTTPVPLPALRHLSMLGCPACPNYMNGGSLAKYKDYRAYVVSRMPQLVLLEDQPVTAAEREAARLKYGAISSQSEYERR